ncbi:Kinesin light chain [Paramyrothecium foliicola]|nr:Kinesin light chain [Paramyrothecium foliicola]
MARYPTTIMEGLGAAANIIAVVDLSAKVATLCLQYSKEVASARADIQRLHTQVEHLGTALRASQRLLKDAKAQSLLTSHELVGSFRECIAELKRLKDKLDPSPARTTMRRLGLRALKWPFNSKEVDQLLTSLERHEKTIMLGLQIDQTAVLVDIQERVKHLGLQSTEDASTSLKPRRMMSFPPDRDYVQRPIIEKWIQEQYVGPDRRMALVGMGGFGKSQLANEFAHHIHATKPGTSIFWVHGNSKATFEESYRALADVLELPHRHEPDVDLLALVRDCLQKDDMSPWLMIVDNADDIGVFFPDGRQDDASKQPLASYLPKSTIGKILVTSRSLDAAEKLVGYSRAVLRIPVMGENQALELLQRRLEGEVDEAAAIDLVLALDCIPLAVSQAAAYINRRSPRVTTTSYLDEFAKNERRKDSLLRSDKGDLGRYDGVSNSVVVTWQVTFEQIRRERPGAANLLSLMSQFQAHNIPESMLQYYDDDVISDDESDRDSVDMPSSSDEKSTQGDFEDDLDVLRGYSLITTSPEGFCEMHSLVQFCTRSWIADFGDPERWSRLFLKLAAHHFPSGQFETWGTCQSLLPHFELILHRSPNEKRDLLRWATLLKNVSWYMLKTGEYSTAETLAHKAAEIRTNNLGPDNHSTLVSMSCLVLIFLDQGRLDEAEKLQIEVLQTRKMKLGADHPDTLTSINNLASIFQNQGRWDEAEKLQIEVLQACKMKLGADHPDTLSSMNNLASILRNQGRWDEAEKLQIEELQTCKMKLGADHPDTLTSMNNLASTFWNQGRWDEAEKLQIEVLQTRKMKLGADHYDTLSSMNNLASILRNQGRWDEAEKLQIEELQTCKIKLGADHPDTLTSMNNLALTFWGKGRWDEAEKLQLEALEAHKMKLGTDHPTTLASMNNLATTWYDQGRQEEALHLLQNCVCLRRKRLGHSHPDTQASIARLKSWQPDYSPTENNLSVEDVAL